MNRPEAISLATHLARRVFEVGSDPHCIITRIQFMSGTWPDHEKPRGGLSEAALASVLTDFLLEHSQRR